MNRKAAIRLSVNLIVVIIIAIVSMGFASTFFFQQQEELNILTGIVEQQAKQQIMKELVQTTSKVVLPIFSADMKRGETETFGLGIKNYIGYLEEFTVKISFDSALDSETKAVVDPVVDVKKFFISSLGPYKLEDKEREIVNMPIRVPSGTPRGVTYIFDVEVKCETDNAICKPYGYVQQIEISVI